jgi:hypothetical protein
VTVYAPGYARIVADSVGSSGIPLAAGDHRAASAHAPLTGVAHWKSDPAAAAAQPATAIIVAARPARRDGRAR